jgi:hypothetical protein
MTLGWYYFKIERCDTGSSINPLTTEASRASEKRIEKMFCERDLPLRQEVPMPCLSPDIPCKLSDGGPESKRRF